MSSKIHLLIDNKINESSHISLYQVMFMCFLLKNSLSKEFIQEHILEFKAESLIRIYSYSIQ